MRAPRSARAPCTHRAAPRHLAGGVGTGPLVLLLQLALDVGPLPERWQWVAMFAVTAGVMVVGICCAASLFAQYWGVSGGWGSGGLVRWRSLSGHHPHRQRC